MKKILSIILTICMLMSALCISSYALTEQEIYSAFDFDNDGDVDVKDARTVLRVAAGIDAPIEGKVYDINGDGYVTYEDVKTALYIAAGIGTEDVAVNSDEYNLNLFKREINSIKEVRPGFTKNATAQCASMLVTTRNAPDSSLNVTNMEFDDYTNKTCDYMEDLLNGAAGLLIPSAQKAELKQNIADLRQKATDMYKPQTTKKTVAKRTTTHYTDFPINNLGYSCYLTLDDIESIRCYEEGDYFYREVTMKTDTYVGNEYPTGSAGFKDRYQKISYGKIFNIPALSETDGSVVNKVTFKDGKITMKIDKLTGMPVNVEYYYVYVADVDSPVQEDADGNPGIEMNSVTTMVTSENYAINPVEVN